MACGKVVFTKKDAAHALRYISEKGRQHQRECRMYFCAECKAWHLSSKGSDTKIMNIDLKFYNKWKRLINK